MKGCSSLGRLRYAALLRIGEAKNSSLCLVDVKEGVTAAAPRAAKVEMPRDNAVRVVTGAKALSPNLGERMMAARLLEKAVVVRELMPQDLKIEIDRLSRQQAMSLARYLAGVVGRAHGRQMDIEPAPGLALRSGEKPQGRARRAVVVVGKRRRTDGAARSRLSGSLPAICFK